ncbi:hypothetical protein AB4561_11920 [Vibrio sp. 10N.222.55.A3]|uniref:hypothetical protein n=1 Tax=unclassified Vibrio TaxID=2614977 RepID=UPI003551CB86
MGFISKVRDKVRSVSTNPIDHPENRAVVEKILEQAHSTQRPHQRQRVKPTRFDDGCDGYYSKGNWWDDSNDMDEREWKEEAFDQYAREFHSLETHEERYDLYNKDRNWMMN